MWLFPELMRLLRPVILERARPGTRVLTSTWDLGTWPPDKVDTRTARRSTCGSCRRASAGGWHWDLQVGGRRFSYARFSNSSSRPWKASRARATAARSSKG